MILSFFPTRGLIFLLSLFSHFRIRETALDPREHRLRVGRATYRRGWFNLASSAYKPQGESYSKATAPEPPQLKNIEQIRQISQPSKVTEYQVQLGTTSRNT